VSNRYLTRSTCSTTPILESTDQFLKWLGKLRDPLGKARILARLNKAYSGHIGDTKSICGTVFELRIDVGPGYRVYFIKHNDVMILLCGGDKSSQTRDVVTAKILARNFKDK